MIHTIIDVCLLVSILDFLRDEPRMRTPLVLPSEGLDGGVGFGGGAGGESSGGLRPKPHKLRRVKVWCGHDNSAAEVQGGL